MVDRIYRKLRVGDQNVVLRPMARTDLGGLLAFINRLVDDKKHGNDLQVFTGFEHRVTREEEAEWLANRMIQIKNGDMVSVLAEVGGRIVANGNVERGHYAETRHHGELGLTVVSEFRGMGIGSEMVKVLVREAKRIGLKSLEVEFLSTSRAASRTYRKAGFHEVGRMPGKVHRGGKFLDSVVMAREV